MRCPFFSITRFRSAAAPILAASLLALLNLSVGFCSADDAQVTVHPEETDEILANPGMGWQTFHRTVKQDKNLPSWIPSTVHYARWGWGELEPEPGRIAEAFLDRVLAESREAGQQLAFRVMCCSTTPNRPYHPAWIKEIGGRELISDYDGKEQFPIPDLDDQVTLQRHLDFIQRLGEKYDGHPDLDHLDLGSVGWWGEWHLSRSSNCKLPALENRVKIVNAYVAAFRKTPLLMLIGGRECLAYATDQGTGWRADCLGDMGGFSKNWCHMRKGYPDYFRQGKLQDIWQSAPIAWETCWDMRKWVQEGWSLRYIFNYALACHASYINNKSAPLPKGDFVRPELERFLRRLGYRLVLKELRHEAEVKAGANLAVYMKWQNVGSAPCYRPYRLAYRLSADGGAVRTIPSEITVNRWLPGSVELFTDEFLREPPELPPGKIDSMVWDRVGIPNDLPAGTYTLSIAVVEPGSVNPAVQLGIKGRAADGWYPLSSLKVLAIRDSTGMQH